MLAAGLTMMLVAGCRGNTSNLEPATMTPANTVTPEIPVAVSTTEVPDANVAVGYPKIANLWGLYRLDRSAEYYANFDLMIPYTFKEAERVSAEIYQLDPQAMILHSQFGTKGREELDALIHEWSVSKKGDPGYACLLRDSAGNILITSGWKHPMVNLINEDCRARMAEKNINEFLQSGLNAAGKPIYTGIYWDLLFGKISWLGDDIDSNLDGIPDIEDDLNEEYKRSVIDYLRQVRLGLPQAQLMGNEAPIEYATLINGRLFEWQIPALLDGLELNSWEEIIEEYQQWAVSGVEPRTTIIENAPEQILIDKFGTAQVNEMPLALVKEAETSYQRMRFGLVSALMSDGYYSFDLGKTAHGQFWWYDEYGRRFDDTSSPTLPPQGYLGQPVDDPHTLKSSIESKEVTTMRDVIRDLVTSPEEDVESTQVWARKFEHGIVIANPTNTLRSVILDREYCRLNGAQAPLSEVRVEDNEAEHSGGWRSMDANFDQFAETVLSISMVKGAAVVYRPELYFSGNYEVLAWISPEPDQAREVEYEIAYSGGTTTVTIDQSAGEPGWRSLGVYPFEKGNHQEVKVYSSLAGTVVADAVKWVSLARFNDGSRSDALLIEAHDGIILVDCGINEGNE